MSMIAFYNNQSEPTLVDEYKLADPIEDDITNDDLTNDDITHHFTTMSMIAFYNNQSEPTLVDEYKLADSTDEDITNDDITNDDDRSDIILPTQKEIVMELPKYIARSKKKAPKQLNYGLILATLFKDVYEIAAEMEAINQKNCRRNIKFLKHMTTMECVY